MSIRIPTLFRYELSAPSAGLKKQWLEALARVTNLTPVGEGYGDGAEGGSASPYALEGYLVKLSGGNSTAKKWDARHFRLRTEGEVAVSVKNKNGVLF